MSGDKAEFPRVSDMHYEDLAIIRVALVAARQVAGRWWLLCIHRSTMVGAVDREVGGPFLALRHFSVRYYSCCSLALLLGA